MIRLTNVRTHNLKNLSLDIPYGQWLSICGVSGSGKSSLAFDTLFAEGQRRYLECLAPATRKMLTLLDKPDADQISGIPPAVAVQPRQGRPDRKTSVGNATDLIEFLRILFAQIGQAHCPACHAQLFRWDPGRMVEWLDRRPSGERYMVTFFREINDANEWEEGVASGRKNGFLRGIFRGESIDLNQPASDRIADFWPSNSPPQTELLFYVVDRLVTGSSERSRVYESIELALHSGDGTCQMWMAESPELAPELAHWEGPAAESVLIQQQRYNRFGFCNQLVCSPCQRTLPLPEPTLFSYNRPPSPSPSPSSTSPPATSPSSTCPACQGVGFADRWLRLPCLTCSGSRLVPDGLAFQVGGKNIGQLGDLPIEQLSSWIDGLQLSPRDRSAAEPLLTQIKNRLGYLQQVGLGHLMLNRPLVTLSEGEQQRVLLTSCLGSTLANILYVLDEPTRGLHGLDIGPLIESIRRLQQRGNTVLVVDHRDNMLAAAERIVEVGPSAGEKGGELVFDGTPLELIEADTTTADFFSGRRGKYFAQERRPTNRGSLVLSGASGNNLNHLTVKFPLRCLCCVAGVSGAGKTTLVKQTLFPAIRDHLKKGGDTAEPKTEQPPSPKPTSDQQDPLIDRNDSTALPFQHISGCDRIEEVVMLDTSPIGRSGRSNPVTFINAFDEIRKVFADTADAKKRNFKAGHFSFNIKGGRCDRCEGAGERVVDMQFLPEMHLRCEECQGTRFKRSTLDVRYRGLNIAETLRLTAAEAFSFFRGQPKVQAKLKNLIDVGLGYLQIGQAINQLSSGEAQRLKLANFLNSPRKQRTLFILEEPTAGLHAADVVRLLDCFDLLLSVGHSLIVIEHHPLLLANADWVIELGPGGGPLGGNLVASGCPQQLIANSQSPTGRYLSDQALPVNQRTF